MVFNRNKYMREYWEKNKEKLINYQKQYQQRGYVRTRRANQEKERRREFKIIKKHLLQRIING
ncbi:hypothetical protein LCGC14_0969540 [marine sediment metagenome]|uniref:Uncharacterized protein n=1 Tax=marine sediment metagenome TaxID=412755 RepID=A0A0F9QV88_9ZZZZ